jgi:hypothetical protein
MADAVGQTMNHQAIDPAALLLVTGGTTLRSALGRESLRAGFGALKMVGRSRYKDLGNGVAQGVGKFIAMVHGEARIGEFRTLVSTTAKAALTMARF